jgi:hypothetical protein
MSFVRIPHQFDKPVADLTKPVYRHLLEQRWKNEGALDLVVRQNVAFVLNASQRLKDGACAPDECRA